MLQPEWYEGKSDIQPFADNFTPIIPTDHSVHTDERHFCYDATCPCHEDQDEISIVDEWVQQGLMSPENAREYVMGRTL